MKNKQNAEIDIDEAAKYLLVGCFPLRLVWDIYLINIFSRPFRIKIPRIVKISCIAYVDFKTENMDEGIIESLVTKTNCYHTFDTFFKDGDTCSQIVCIEMETAELVNILPHIDNIPDKAGVLYGLDKKEKYIEERNKHLQLLFSGAKLV